MSKRTSLEMKKAILEVLADKVEHSYVDLERKVNTNWQTVRTQCKELEVFEAVTITENKVKITDKGIEYLKKLK